MAMQSNRAAHIAALIERIGRLLSTEAHAEGLLPVQWEALRYLGKANRFSRTAAALTAYLGLTKGTVSQTLNALETRKLVKKQVDPKDRRSKRLSLTAKGQKLLQRDPLDATVVAVDQLASSSRRAIAEGLESLLTTRLADRNRLPFGQCRDCQYFARCHRDGSPHFCLLLREKLQEADTTGICCEQVPAQ